MHHVTLTVQNALKRLPALYLSDFSVREILRLPDAEEAWLRECWGTSQEEHNPVFGRLDALVDFTSPMWKESLRFVEPNLMGIGGLHIVPTCERLIAEHRRARAPERRHGAGSRRWATTSGSSSRRCCSSTWRPSARGRQRVLRRAQVRRERPGRAGAARPLPARAARAHGHARGSVGAGAARRARSGTADQRVDLAYRDYGVVDLLELAEEGVDVEPMRVLLRENRMVSSIAADLDQKACWEVLHRSAALPPVFHAGRAPDLRASHPVDPRAERPTHGAPRRPRTGSCSTTPARTTKRWCSSRTAPTAATAS